MTMKYQVVGESLRSRRMKANYTQNELAKLLHVKIQSISNVETGRMNIPIRWMPVLSKALKWPLKELRDTSFELYYQDKLMKSRQRPLMSTR